MPYKFISDIKDFKNNNIKAVRKLLDRLREDLWMNFINITDIDELAQQTKAEKIELFEDFSVDNSETKHCRYVGMAKHLESDTYNYTSASVFSITLADTLYYSSRRHILLTKTFKVIAESLGLVTKRSLQRYIKEINLIKLFLNKHEYIPGHSCLLRNFRNQNYYHCLIDNLPKIYHLNQEPYRSIPEINLLISGKLSSAEEFFLAKILPSNVKIKFVREDCCYHLEKCIFVQPLTRWMSGYLPRPYLEHFAEKALPQRARNRKNRIFISRKSASKRHIKNESELMSCLRPYGFKSYSLENLTVEEQAELFYDAEYIIGVHGAGMSNILFAEQANVLEIFPGSEIIPHYYFLSKSLGHKHQLFFANASNNINEKAFEVNVTELMEILELDLELELVEDLSQYCLV
ncbi:MAG: DUF563 domain-containing protein [Leptolyngbyaceae cyanobacterium]